MKLPRSVEVSEITTNSILIFNKQSPKMVTRHIKQKRKLDALQSPDSTTKTLSRLQLLPTELQLEILSHLSVTDIASARVLNHRFASLIDTPQNHQTLYYGIQIRALARINETVSSILHYDPCSVGFVEALSRFTAYRGISLWPEDRRAEIEAFIQQWMFLCHGVHMVDYTPSNHFDFYWMLNALICFFDLYTKRLESMLSTGVRFQKSCGCYSWYDAAGVLHHGGARHLDQLAAGDATILELFSIVQGGSPSDFPTGPIRGSELKTAEERGEPEWLLTTPFERYGNRRYGLCKVERLVKLFGVPRFDSSNFAYCVRSKWAYEKVREALQAVEDDSQLTSILTPAAKARVLEDMYLL